MRRLFCLCLAFLLLPSFALCQNASWDAAFAAIDALKAPGLSQDASFSDAGGWLSVTVTQSGQIAPMTEGTQYIGLVFDAATGERVGWEDIFIDGDAAAERMERIASESTFQNAYSEYTDISPMPRDSFIIEDGVLTVFYPATQLSWFSGRSGGFSYYAYELEGLLSEGVPLEKGDPARAGEALDAALEKGALPGPLAEWALGRSLLDADAALGLVDVPDLSREYAIYRFEAPEMRGVSLLSTVDDANVAVIEGIMAERIDFGGLCTGVSTKTECFAALGEPTGVGILQGADAYSRLPNGERMLYTKGEHTVEMHFVDDVLYSVAIF